MQSNLYIPQKIHVGFQKRNDTYTGKLAYVIYEDEKGTLRKKDSWDGWRDKEIKEVILDNNPARFVFNKGVQRYGSFGSGRSVMRVYDTRDFEFEISIDNLVGILMHSDISKRDIMEECVFAWAGKDLILLPVNSEEYRTSVEYTDKQSLKLSTKDLVKGYLYEKKKSDGQLMYIGYHDFFDKNGYRNEHKNFGKKHVFYDMNLSKFVIPSPATIAKAVLEEVHSDFAKIDEKLHKSYHLSELKTFDIEFNKKVKKDYRNPEFYLKNGNEVIHLSYSTYYSTEKIRPDHCWIQKGTITKVGKGLTLEFENLKTNDSNDIARQNELYKKIGVDWITTKSGSSYYPSISTTGSEISIKEFVEKLQVVGFGNTLIAVNLNNQRSNWNN